MRGLGWFRCVGFMVILAAGLLAVATGDGGSGSGGKKIGAFALPNTQGKEWNWSAVRSSKAVVVIFIGTECPVNNAYMPRLAELHTTYAVKGVAFLAINANQQDAPAKVAAHAKRFRIPFPVLKDGTAKVA